MTAHARHPDRGAIAEPPRFTPGEPFDPAELTEEEAAHILAAVDAFPGLSQSAKETYRALFMLARQRERGDTDGL